MLQERQARMGRTPASRSGRLALALLALSVAGLPSAAAEVVGWRGDGSGVYPDQNPPVHWEDHIRWRTPLPNWSNSSPIVSEGKVFLTSEPDGSGEDAWAPLLICIDAKSGAELWRRPIDHLAHLPGGKEAAARWGAAQDLARTLVGLWHEDEWLNRQQVSDDDPRRQEWRRRMQEQQARLAERNPKHKELRPIVSSPKIAEIGAMDELLDRYGLTWPTWGLDWRAKGPEGSRVEDYYDFGGRITWIGHAYPTPLADGERVYVVTNYHAVAAYDYGGELQWMHFIPPPSHEERKQRALHGWPGMHFCFSPRWADDKLIVQAGGDLRAFDPVTGEAVWEIELPGWAQHKNNDLVILTVGGQDVIVHPDGTVYRARDGRPMVTGLGAIGKGGGTFNGHGDRVYIHQKAVRLMPESDDALRLEVLWDHGEGSKGEVYETTPYGADVAVTATRLFPVGRKWPLICDADSGRVLVGKPLRFLPANGICPSVAGRYLVTGNWQDKTSGIEKEPDEARHYAGSFGVYDIEGAGEIVINRLSLAPAEGEKLRQHWRHGEIEGWPMFSSAEPFFAHDRIYIRSYDHLYCIGTR